MTLIDVSKPARQPQDAGLSSTPNGSEHHQSLHERGMMHKTAKFLLLLASIFGAISIVCTPVRAEGQPGYGPGPRITCSSDDGKRHWCNIGPSRDARLVRQISGSPCVRGSTWGVDRGGLWVDRGCRAEFVAGGGGAPPPPGPGYGPGGGGGRMVTCSSDDGRRNWCSIGPSRDVRLVNQRSGSACVRGSTWGVDGRGLWVDRGCRADFSVR